MAWNLRISGYRWGLLGLLLWVNLATSLAQITPAQRSQARQELKRRNINEAELRARLLERGLDVENMNPAELAAAQAQIEQVIAEMELENRRTTIAPDTSRTETEKRRSPAETVLEDLPELSEPPQELAEAEVWGHQVFRNKSLQVYSPSDNVRAPESYRLESGDVIAINIFGASQGDLKLRVDQDGFIAPPAMPRIQVAGLRIDEARRLAQSRFRRYYDFRQGQFTFNVDRPRTITVNIYGETETNGSFTLSAVNTVFNALVAAGGPNGEGSLRNVKLISDGSETRVDLYEYLLNPTQQPDLFLKDNDVIFVPLASKVVTVQGAIKRPLRYELLAEEGLDALLAFAGGLQPNAIAEAVTINRTQGNDNVVIDAAVGATTPLQDGDLVSVPESQFPERSRVVVSGAVAVPGDYAFREGMRVSDLLRRGKLLPGSKKDAGFLRRFNADSTTTLIPIDYNAALAGEADDNLLLQSEDQLIVFQRSVFVPRYRISIGGAVNAPVDSFPYSASSQLTVRDGILLAGGLKDNASNEAFLIRQRPENGNQREYVSLDLDQSTAMDRILRPLDSLVIYDNERFSESFPVNISGAVRFPGRYVYDPSLGLAELFKLAGGLRIEAARNRVDVFRLEFGQNETTRTTSTSLEIDEDFRVIGGPAGGFTLRPFDVVVIRSVPEFELIRTVLVEGEVRFPGDYALDSDNLKLTDLIFKAGGLTAEAFPPGATLDRMEDSTGLVVIRLDEAIAAPNGISNLILKDGDVLSIPKAQQLVAIRPLGTRINQVYDDSLFVDGTLDVAFNGKRTAKWYVDNYAGGFENRARRSSLTVRYANGELGRTKKFLWWNVYPKIRPGSSVQLEMKPPKPERKRREEPVDWVGITQAALGGITAFVTIYLLVDRTRPE